MITAYFMTHAGSPLSSAAADKYGAGAAAISAAIARERARQLAAGCH